MKLDNNMPESVRARLFSLCDLNRQEWRLLEEWFNNTQENFMNRFREEFHMLTEEDYEIIMLIRLNLTHEEIARIGNVTVKSFKMRRHRIKKKMQIECIHLSHFILQLYKEEANPEEP